MTRRRLNRILWTTVAGVALYGALMAVVVFFGEAWFGEAFAGGVDNKVFGLLRDAAPLAIGIAAAILANAFQKRGRFIDFLRDEWYNIVETKTRLIRYARTPNKTYPNALEAWASLSSAIDRMRILYRNVGETDALIGYYPYEPLHDMRRAFEGAIGCEDSLNGAPITPKSEAELETVDWKAVEMKIWTAFTALREVFLEELDLREPDYPVLRPGAGRKKSPGAASAAERAKAQDERRAGA